MIRLLPLLLLGAIACDGGKGSDTAEATFDPTVIFLAPTDGATVTAGEVQVSLSFEDFVLTAPTARVAHNEEGEPAGYVELSLDGAVVATDLVDPQYTLSGVAAGEHTLDAELYYEDRDEVGVSASITFTAE